VTVGALGVGPLISGCLAQWVTQPLTVPYLVFIALGAIALAGLWAAPETGAPATQKGSGAVFKGTTGVVLEASPPESRVAMTSDLLIAFYVGLSVPVIGAGVALDLGRAHLTPCSASPSSSGWALLGHRKARS
jgi:hypothetical protein